MFDFRNRFLNYTIVKLKMVFMELSRHEFQSLLKVPEPLLLEYETNLIRENTINLGKGTCFKSQRQKVCGARFSICG